MHISQDKGLKPHFGPLFGPKRPIFGSAIFFQHLDNHQVLDSIISNQNMQNRQKLMHNSQENLILAPFLALIDPNKSFLENRVSSLF